MKIEALFDSSKNIYRTIEKVITYGSSQEVRLKSEILEYVVTDSIEEQFEKLLTKMQSAMEVGGENEVGVWVSGFYGSGKSSFTKYLGLAFDDSIKIDGTPFLQHLQDRLNKSTTKALLSNVAKRFPAAVLMLDLASEQVAGATMEEVSTVLFYKVLQWAGYSRNLKVAALERKLKKEGRHDDFLKLFKDRTGEKWSDYRNDDLVVDSIIPEIAHQLYPALFKTPSSFSTETSEVIRFENDRVQEMIEIVRETSGKKYIIFIIDEVGQYVGSRQQLILNLQGLAENLKKIGDGKVWLFGTAQQTLTEDDAKASLNSPELYKLKDRFPVAVELEAKDIKEICYRRLLGKSSKGEAELGGLFDKYGQALRQNTKLVDARVYGADFDRKTFIDLYPFLPAHFDILLHLLGALAKSTGGIGLRSAIKVVQDVLVEGADGNAPMAQQKVGVLANTVTLYDALEKDIRRAFPSLYQAAGKVNIRFPKSVQHQNIAKTVCVLQILGNLPISLQNITSLMHPGVADVSLSEGVKRAVEDLISDPIVPFGEQNGNLVFFSEKLNEIEQERATIVMRSIELRRIQSEALKEAYSPLPATQLNGSLSVTTGLKVQQLSGGTPLAISGERNTLQTIVELVEPADYETTKSHLIDESRHPTSKYNIFLLGRITSEMVEMTREIYRSKEIVLAHRNDPDQEVKEYCTGQSDRANKLMVELERLIKRSLLQGSYVFRGELTAVETLEQDVMDSARRHLSGVAEQVFDRNAEAAVRAGTDLAEKFLRQGSLTGITTQIDPLNLVKMEGGRLSINTNHQAIISIRDTIDRQGSSEGKRLTEIFTDAPYGWSPDTLRYLIAAMLMAGEIKLKMAGREITVNGQHAIEALKTNNSFKTVGVSLRTERPPMEMLGRAAERLTELGGDMVLPLEDEISKATIKLLPRFQQQYGPLAEKLKTLKLPGADRLENLSQDITDILFSDASDAPQRLGGEESDLFENLKWASELKRAMEQGMEQTLRDLQHHRQEVENLPDGGTPGALKSDLTEELGLLRDRLEHEEFFRYKAEFSSSLTTLRARVRDTVIAMQSEQQERIKDAEQDLFRIVEWKELTQQEQNNIMGDLEKLIIWVSEDLSGLRSLVNQEYAIQSQMQDIKQRIQRIGQQRLQEKLREEQEQISKDGPRKITRTMELKGRITTLPELDGFINELGRLRSELQYAHEFEFTIKLANSD